MAGANLPVQPSEKMVHGSAPTYVRNNQPVPNPAENTFSAAQYDFYASEQTPDPRPIAAPIPGPYTAATVVAAAPSRGRYCGLSSLARMILLSLIVLVILAAIITVAVVVSLRGRHSRVVYFASPSGTAGGFSASTSCSSTFQTISTSIYNVSSSAPTTSFEASTSVYLGFAPSATPATATTMNEPTGLEGAYNCPAENGTTYTSSTGLRSFEILCDVDWPVGVPGVQGGQVIDLNDGVIADSVQACIELCVTNYIDGGSCTAVTYGANITLALSRGGITGNCFLKDQRGMTDLADNSGQVMSAFLVSS